MPQKSGVACFVSAAGVVLELPQREAASSGIARELIGFPYKLRLFFVCDGVVVSGEPCFSNHPRFSTII